MSNQTAVAHLDTSKVLPFVFCLYSREYSTSYSMKYLTLCLMVISLWHLLHFLFRSCMAKLLLTERIKRKCCK
ncbi:hypothetical protein M433DRAFT_387163 [Acidomyces richmondensis BFW]|nr:MAG: hypothetical protein FE78DRAFT_334874 [Acidomyces sp. 'richmondensis']KYG42859.1 hypothetical protein M433DRAFT_387163 [Acidomyces richmondensis BFW]